MNFKTTAVLLVLLIAVGAYALFTRDKANAPAPVPVVHTVLDVKPGDVSAVAIAGPDGKPVLAMARDGANWKLTQPTPAPADAFKANTPLNDLTINLKSTNTVAATGADAPKTGVDHPQYTVTLTTGTNGASKDVKLALGDRLAVGDGVYAQVAGSDTVDVVPASLLDTLARPATDLRNTQLFNGVTAADVQQLSVTHKDGSKVSLAKVAGTWKIVAPQPMPADASAVEDLLATVINLVPVSFVDDPKDAVGLNRPTDVVSFGTAPAATLPTTGPAATSGATPPTVVTFGGYDDVQKKNVFAQLTDGSVVKVAASVLDSVNKSPLDLRDKAVLDIDPAKVTRLTIAVATPATTQPVAAAVTKTVVLTRRPPKPAVMGPVMSPAQGPSTKPTTKPSSKSTTGPATAPAPTTPATDWLVDGADADDAKVTALLGQFHPLRADKFLPASGVAHPARRLTVTLTATGAAPVVVQIDDLGHSLSPIGSAAGLTFELPTTIATDLTADFKKGATPAVTPEMPPSMSPMGSPMGGGMR